VDPDGSGGGVEGLEWNIIGRAGAVGAAGSIAVQLGEVDAAGDEIVLGEVPVATGVELIAARLGGSADSGILEIGNAVEAAAGDDVVGGIRGVAESGLLPQLRGAAGGG
jgi:hypothetical protein